MHFTCEKNIVIFGFKERAKVYSRNQEVVSTRMVNKKDFLPVQEIHGTLGVKFNAQMISL